MTGRLHTCPAPTLSGVGFISAPFRPGAARSGPFRSSRSHFHNFSTSAAAPDPLIPYFCYPDPLWVQTLQPHGLQLARPDRQKLWFCCRGVLKSQSFTFLCFATPRPPQGVQKSLHSPPQGGKSCTRRCRMDPSITPDASNSPKRGTSDTVERLSYGLD